MNRWTMKRDRESGFTIVELLTVIIVIGILAALVIVGYGAATGSAHDSAVKSDLKKIDDAFKQYALDNEGTFPYTRSGLETLKLKLAQGSYDTNNKANIYLCVKSNHKEYAVVAQSRSGKRFVVSSEAGIQDYSGGVAWSPSVSAFGATCASIDATYISPNGISGIFDGSWIAWASGQSSVALVCPDDYIVVPGNNSYGTSDFCVMKYEARNVGDIPTSTGAGPAWVNITQADAVTVAQDACTGCHLITDAEWLTIATNVASISSNWTGGSVGSGSLYTGHSDNSPATVLVDVGDASNGYIGTGNTTGSNQRRTLNLSNGSVIWDFSGNYYEWTSLVVPAGQSPGVPSDVSASWRDWNTVGMVAHGLPDYTIPSNVLPSASGWTRTQGMGGVYSNYNDAIDRPAFRGGWRADGSNVGIFTLNLSVDTSYSGVGIGFRVAGVPAEEN